MSQKLEILEYYDIRFWIATQNPMEWLIQNPISKIKKNTHTHNPKFPFQL